MRRKWLSRGRWAFEMSLIHNAKRKRVIEELKAKTPNGVLRCFFCGKEIIKTEGLDDDSLILHSLDGNHVNWESSNKVPSHNDCHTRWHNTGERSHWRHG